MAQECLDALLCFLRKYTISGVEEMADKEPGENMEDALRIVDVSPVYFGLSFGPIPCSWGVLPFRDTLKCVVYADSTPNACVIR